MCFSRFKFNKRKNGKKRREISNTPPEKQEATSIATLEKHITVSSNIDKSREVGLDSYVLKTNTNV